MGKWVKLDPNMWMMLKIFIAFIIICIVLSLIFKYLIKSNKIKPSKVSRIFYIDDEKFIKSWEKSREKGKLRYGLYYITTNCVLIWVMLLIIIAVTTDNFSNEIKYILPAFIGTLIGEIIGLLSRWNTNEEKYNKWQPYEL